ncbi:TPA: GNAT family N-acetyltransferase [Streptococcus mutans]|uniref:GNAT family N-acetyltransferase n=1 Tax=Streptococcus mutans TaxID=1309 RepID=UPI0002B5EE4C|nr:N-acetyltransferase [Streptococcus mutans]EMC01482.1 putative acetyltransferase [Streptococcus mutans N34]MBT3147655.1 GNAT family N-acetyltransferase [Streptococcus mutans]MBW3479027.1 GNAT family N-acetyltransferase [Streptococcus mutans]MCB4928520.1 GNAT family N-acetyltransferase [Streptococcus mutans]MCB4932614.1 GNAT family N-acetyltransferase [Streptococcus mutans]
MPQVEIRKVNQDELSLLQKIAIQTFRETFAFDNTAEQLQDFFDEAYTLSALKSEIADKESETYFILMSGKAAGFLKVNWGSSQTEQVLEDAFEIQRVYILKAYQGQGLGKQLFEFALERAQISGLSWVWLGVWEKNFKAQSLYAKYGFKKFAEHTFAVGDKEDTDWLLKKSLK